GEASFATTAPLSIGTHSIIVYYHSSNSYITANGSLSQVIRSATTSTLSSSANPSGLGLSVTFTATVKPVSPGSGVPDGSVTFTATVTPAANTPAGTKPTGTVSFFDGTTALGTVSLDTNSQAHITSAGFSAGVHSIKAVYSGSTAFVGTTSNVVSQTVLNTT